MLFPFPHQVQQQKAQNPGTVGHLISESDNSFFGWRRTYGDPENLQHRRSDGYECDPYQRGCSIRTHIDPSKTHWIIQRQSYGRSLDRSHQA